MKEKLQNPKEAIYLLLYLKPLSLEKISETLYGSRNARVSEYVNKLRRKKWIKIKTENDMRKKVCYATYRGFYDSILQSLKDVNISLETKEKKTLRAYLKSELFRSEIMDLYADIDLKKGNYNLSFVKEILSFSLMYALYMNQYMTEYLGINISDKKIFFDTIIEAIKQKRTINKSIVAFQFLGYPLSEKLSKMMGVRSSYLHIVFDHLISHIDRITKAHYSNADFVTSFNVNGNGHGLS